MNKFIQIAVLLLCTVAFSVTVEGQLVRKFGGHLLRKAGVESSKKAGKQAIVQSTKSAARHVVTSTGRKAALHSGHAVAGSASKLVKHYGDDSLKLLSRTSSRDARRMLMIADDIPAGQRQQLMTFIAGHDNPSRVIDVLYKHRGELLTGGLVAMLLTQPEEVLSSASEGVATIVDAMGRSIVTPVAEKAAKPIGRYLGLTICLVSLLGVGTWLSRFWLPKRLVAGTSQD